VLGSQFCSLYRIFKTYVLIIFKTFISMKTALRTLGILLLGIPFSLSAQKPSFTANDIVNSNAGTFAYGANQGYYVGYNNNVTNDNLFADLLVKAGCKTSRPKLYEAFIQQYGINIRIKSFKYYVDTLKMQELTLFLDADDITTYTAHQATDSVTCNGTKYKSKLYKNLYLPIWDDSVGGKTPINEQNYYAAYVYNIVKTYGPYVRYYEVWNEPDFTSSSNAFLASGAAGNWLDNNPPPCDLTNLYAPLTSYVRLLRITYEVVKALSPTSYVATGGIGYPNFLDAVLRNTDNPNGGAVSADYPLTGGAYFDVLSFHSYPQFTLNAWNNTLGKMDYFRYSDYAIQKFVGLKSSFTTVLSKYGYGGKFPAKRWIVTETNIPRKRYTDMANPYIGSDTAQRNYVLKAYVYAQKNNVQQMYIYCLGDSNDESASVSSSTGNDLMGLYYNLKKATPATATLTPTGVAVKTMTSLLYGYAYDSVKTKSLNFTLNKTSDGAAFTKGTTTYYVLWAKTTRDLSEAASATFTLPSNLASGGIVYNWDYSSTNTTTSVTGSTIALTGSPILLKTTLVTGVEKEEELQNGLTIYPNPSKGELNILRNNASGDLNVSVLDLSGKEVKKFVLSESGEQSLATTGIPSGVYQLKFSNANQSWVKKWVLE
jgi:hypothetical protein